MHWADKLAGEIIERRPDKEEYICAAGISPSGSVHIGNFRDIATSYFVCLALRRAGKKAKLLFSWDEFDRLRKVPKNVADKVGDNSYEKYIGYPYVDIPDPFGQDESYAAHFEKEFMRSVERFGIEMEYHYQAQEYRSGRYAEDVVFALKKRKEIFDVLDRHRTQDAEDGERDSYYPVAVYCPECRRDFTRITYLSEDCERARIACRCGYEGEFDFTKDFNCKLQWKVDWPMRWRKEGVDFEPGGKDHASKNGSYDTAKDISKEIFGYEAPLFQGYEFIGIKGSVGKMSGSTGMNLTPDFLLNIYVPEMILWLYAKNDPLKAFDFSLNDDILRQYNEFNRQLKAYRDGTADENTKRIMEDVTVKGHEVDPVPMSQLVDLGSTVNFNSGMMENLFNKIGTPYKVQQFDELLQKAKYWIKTCSPESEYKINKKRNFRYWETMSPEEKECVGQLRDFIAAGGYTQESLKTELYAIPKRVFPDKAENKIELKVVQGKFFTDLYNLLFSRSKGPRLYLYLFAVDPSKYLYLLDFAAPLTEAEQVAEKEENAKAVDAAENAGTVPDTARESASAAEDSGDRVYPDPKPFAENVPFSYADALDIRAVKILSAKPMRKTNKLMKLIVHDGVGERIIVAAIADDYAPETLVGKKAAAVLNLEPKKFGNEYSRGMLFAAVGSNGKATLLFLPDETETGAPVH